MSPWHRSPHRIAPTLIPSDGNVAVLFSYFSTSGSSEDGSALLSYAVAVLKPDSSNEDGGDGLSLVNLLRLPYRSVSVDVVQCGRQMLTSCNG